MRKHAGCEQGINLPQNFRSQVIIIIGKIRVRGKIDISHSDVMRLHIPPFLRVVNHLLT